MYDIKVFYHTGDSFNSYDTDTTLSSAKGWDVETAKKNLKIIKEHYEAVSNRNNYVAIGKNENKLLEALKEKPWYTGKCWEYGMNLYENDGTLTHFSISWTGYFERLIGAELIKQDISDSEWSFRI